MHDPCTIMHCVWLLVPVAPEDELLNVPLQGPPETLSSISVFLSWLLDSFDLDGFAFAFLSFPLLALDIWLLRCRNQDFLTGFRSLLLLFGLLDHGKTG